MDAKPPDREIVAFLKTKLCDFCQRSIFGIGHDGYVRKFLVTFRFVLQAKHFVRSWLDEDVNCSNREQIMKFHAAKRRQAGQGMTEYIIIVALIAVAAIGVYQFFGQTIRNQTAGIAREVSGQSATDQEGAAQSAANSAQGEGKEKGLANYDNPHSNGN